MSPILAVALQEEGSGTSILILAFWVFFLAIFVGFEVITKVPPTLHTPLMSGANAISGITLVGALFCAGTGYPVVGQVLGFLAIVMATVNVVGGFLVTDRMLRMFGSKKGAKK
jgi:NAD(P) transhydrogenase subunit alpha